MENLRIKVESEESERHRIAKDLHDSVGQQLSAIKLYLGALKSIPSGARHPKYEDLISKSIMAVDEAAADLSNICYNLMPVTLNIFGLVYGIKELADKIRLAKKIEVEVITTPRFPVLDKTLEINIFRIVQEFVNNSIKHGKAKHIHIQIAYNKTLKQVYIMLKDNGKGFNVKRINGSAGMGLKNVKSRVDFHKGILAIRSSARSGTAYEIFLPAKNNICKS